jgi:hypothetical protein
MGKLVLIVLMAVILTGCAVKRIVAAPYHFAYCDQMNPDGVHCDWWATPCGKLHCRGEV